jgi:hypothetical protein
VLALLGVKERAAWLFVVRWRSFAFALKFLVASGICWRYPVAILSIR